MPTFTSFAAFIATAVLVLGPATASAERLTFDSAARDSGGIQIFQGKTAYTDRIHRCMAIMASTLPAATSRMGRRVRAIQAACLRCQSPSTAAGTRDVPDSGRGPQSPSSQKAPGL